MKESKYKKTYVKDLLAKTTLCTIQHTGWTCGTCFFAIDDSLTNKDWQALLLFRGDYKREDLRNLPKDVDKSIEKIVKLCE